MSWLAKTGLVLILTLASTVFMYQGWYKPIPAQAAAAFVKSTTAANNGTASTTLTATAFTSAPANGNTLIAVISTRGATAGRVSSITQSGATWSRVNQVTATNNTTEIWYAPNVSAAGTAVTINLAASVVASAVIAEYTGVLTASAVDVTATGTSGTISSSVAQSAGTTTTTTQADELWIAGIGVASGTRTFQTPGNSFVIRSSKSGTNATTANDSSVALLDKIVTATGAATTSCMVTAGTASNSSGLIATFKSSAVVVNPTITSLSPNTLAQGAGPTNVTITGTGFLAGATVTFSGVGVTGTPSSITSTSMTVPVTVTLAAATGARNVIVTNTNTGTVTNTGAFTVTVAAPPSTITTCAGCHGYTSAFIDGASRNDAGRFQGSHNKHVIGTAMACASCHVDVTPADSSNYGHSKGTINMAATISGGTYSRVSPITVTNTFTPGTCSNTTCHGTAASRAWGNAFPAGTNSCTTCHGTPTVTTTPTDLQMAPVLPAAAAHTIHLTQGIGKVVVCAECHETVVTTSTVGHMNGTKTILFQGPVGLGIPTSVAPAATLAGCATSWCHGGNTTLIPQNSPARTAPVWGTTFGTTSVLGTGGTAGTSGTGRCAQCHGYPPRNAQHAGKTLTGTTGCFNCHPNISTTGTISDASIHIDGKIDGGSCTGCHDVGGSGDKNGRVAVTPQFNTAGNSHHVQASTAIDIKACYACHWEANSDGSVNATYHTEAANSPVNLVIWGASTTRPTAAATEGTNMVSYLSGGTVASTRTELAKISTHCVGCHNLSNKTTAPFAAAGDSSTTSKYAWDGIDINTKWIQTGITPWGKFNFTGTTATGRGEIGGTNKKSTINKAFSAHNNATNNAMSGSATTDTTITNISGAVNVLCYDCHNSHGSAVAGITSQYSSATGRNKGGLIKDVAAGKGGYVATYKPVGHVAGTPAGNKSATASGATLCFDCHNSASGTLTAGYTDSGTAPWGYTTFGATQALNGYFDTPYFGSFVTPSASRNWATTTEGVNYKAGTANAKAMPMGGHYGTSVVGTPVTLITKQTHSTTVSAGVKGLCTPCHDPHGVTTNATYVPTQANAVPLLKGTWVTSPYKEDKADIAVKRGGGSQGWAGLTAGGAIPGYHIDQNTLVAQSVAVVGGGAATTSSKGNRRSQKFAPFATSAATQQTFNDTNFAGLCLQCHTKANLTNATAPSAATWKTKERIHQSVKGWAATTGTNAGNVTHAYTCSKCHAPHVSRLPRLNVSNCLDVKHYKQAITGGTIPAAFNTTNPPAAASSGNMNQSTFSTGKGAGRFPGGGSNYAPATAPTQAQNSGPWWFVNTKPTSFTANSTTNYGSNCHNATNAGGATYNPVNQQWNTKTPW